MPRLPFAAEWKGTHSGVNEPRRLVITDEKGWEHLWQTVHAAASPQPPVPQVDFSRHMVLAVFMGRKPTSGFAVQITEVVACNNEVLAFVKETAPPPNPFHIVVVPKVNGTVSFVLPKR